MALTADQVLAELAARGLALRETPAGWVCHQRDGARVRVAPAATPAVAVEAAVAMLDVRVAERQERIAREVVAAQQLGRYFHRPRRERRADPDGGGELEVLVFDLHRADGTTTSITGRDHVAAAWRDLVAALGRGERP